MSTAINVVGKILYLTPKEKEVWENLWLLEESVENVLHRVGLSSDSVELCKKLDLSADDAGICLSVIERLIKAGVLKHIHNVEPKVPRSENIQTYEFSDAQEFFKIIDITTRPQREYGEQFLEIVGRLESGSFYFPLSEWLTKEWGIKSKGSLNSLITKLSYYYPNRESDGWGVILREDTGRKKKKNNNVLVAVPAFERFGLVSKKSSAVKKVLVKDLLTTLTDLLFNKDLSVTEASDHELNNVEGILFPLLDQVRNEKERRTNLAIVNDELAKLREKEKDLLRQHKALSVFNGRK